MRASPWVASTYFAEGLPYSIVHQVATQLFTAMGASLDVPLGHINAAYVRSHFDAISVTVPDAPRTDEIVFVLAMSKGPRIHSRMGGLEMWQVKGEDGLR